MSVADLTGTAWRFNNSLTSVGSDIGTYSLNFESNGNQYTQMVVALGKPSLTLSYNSTTAYSSNAWSTYGGADYQTISITGGTAATNANIIAFIERNATQVVLTHDVTISYNNSTIAYLDASGTEVLETDGTICADDITVEYTKPIPSLQAKTNISPTTSSQTITADGGYDGLSSVQINAMPQGSVTIPYTTLSNNPTISTSNGNITAYGTATQSVTPSVTAGYVSSVVPGTVHAEGSTTVAATSLDANLLAENIKKDVSIFGVTGTYEGSGGGGTALDILIRCNSTSSGWSTSTADYAILSGTISDIFTKSQNKELIEGRLIHYQHAYDDEEDLSADGSLTAILAGVDYSYEGSSFPGWGQMVLHFFDGYSKKRIRIGVDDEQTILGISVSNY